MGNSRKRSLIHKFLDCAVQSLNLGLTYTHYFFMLLHLYFRYLVFILIVMRYRYKRAPHSLFMLSKRHSVLNKYLNCIYYTSFTYSIVLLKTLNTYKHYALIHNLIGGPVLGSYKFNNAKLCNLGAQIAQIVKNW